MMQWQCEAYSGKKRQTFRKTWVRACSEREAMELGRRAFRLLGVRGKFFVSASPYRPERDIAFIGYLAACK